MSYSSGCDAATNGEKRFYDLIRDNIKNIFDVGCKGTVYTDFLGEVHYFDPDHNAIDILSKQLTCNNPAYYNKFGLGNETKQAYYYPRYESFYDRINSCEISDDTNKVIFDIKKSKDYMVENNIHQVDFLKIDTEGYEFHIIQGFEDLIDQVKIIQFEYGGTFLDNNTKLIDVVNYLSERGFHKFSYILADGLEPIVDFSDHYLYCNIVCINKKYDYLWKVFEQ